MGIKKYTDDNIAHLTTLLTQEITNELRTEFKIFDDTRTPAIETDVRALQALARAADHDIKTLQSVAHAH